MLPPIPIVTTTLGAAPELAASITTGLASGAYTRLGGVIRNTSNGQFVAFLRDVGTGLNPVSKSILPLLQLNAAVSIANLSITSVGFAQVLQRLGVIEQRLVALAAEVQAIDRKIDLSFYANFRAALELARSAVAMAGETNRNASASQAINRFLEAEHHYISLLDAELKEGAWAAPQFLSTLTLAFISASRCYLELGEMETARRHLSEAEAVIAPRVRWFYDAVVGTNPAIYLHPKLANEISLERLTQLQRQERPGLTAIQVFEQLREPIWQCASQAPDAWLKKLPKAIWNHDVDGERKIGPVRRRRSTEEIFDRLLPRLPSSFDQVEKAYESLNCIRGYEAELQFLQDKGVGLADWTRLELPHTDNDEGLVCLLPQDSELFTLPSLKQLAGQRLSQSRGLTT